MGRLSWGEKALRDECWGIEAQEEMEAEDALAEAAWRIGCIVAGGRLEAARAWDRLTQAATGAEIELTRALDIIEAAMTRAEATPRVPEPRPQTGRRRLTAADWEGTEAPPREWIWPEWIPAATTTVLFGDGGTGKSLLALQLAAALATGSDFLGEGLERKPVFALFCEEDEDELHRRQEAVNAHLGIAMADLDGLELMPAAGEDNLLMTFDARGRGVDTEFAGRFYGMVEDYAAEHGLGLVIIDTAADVFGGEENSRAQVRQFVSRLNALAGRTRAAVVLLAHPSVAGMATGRGASGSTGWVNGARSHLYFEYANLPDGDDAPVDPAERVLTRKKANYSEKGDRIRMEWRAGAFALSDQPQRKRRERIRLTTAQQMALHALRKALEDHGQPAPPHLEAKDGRMTPLTRWREAADGLGLTPSSQTDTRRKVFNNARNALRDRGLVDWDGNGAWLTAKAG